MRTSARFSAGLGRPARRLVPMLLVVLMLAPVAAGAQVQPVAAPAVREPFCYSWDFLNDTGEDADGLFVVLQGVRSVTSAYMGSDNPFGAPLPSSGYDPGAGGYRLTFAGGPAVDAAPAHIGACTDLALLRLAMPQQGAAFAFTNGGVALQPAPLLLGLGWARLPGGGLRITLYNEQSVPLVIWSGGLGTSDAPLVLDDLNADVFAAQTLLVDLAPDVVTLPAGGSTSVDIPAAALSGLGPNAPLLLSAEFSPESDPGDLGHLYAQLLAPGRTYLPVIQR